MILCTHYGLLIYEWALIPEHMKKKEQITEEEESKDTQIDQTMETPAAALIHQSIK